MIFHMAASQLHNYIFKRLTLLGCLLLCFLNTFSQFQHYKYEAVYNLSPAFFRSHAQQKHQLSFANQLAVYRNFSEGNITVQVGIDASLITKNETGKRIEPGHYYGAYAATGPVYSGPRQFYPNPTLFDSLPSGTFKAIYFTVGLSGGAHLTLKGGFFVSSHISLLFLNVLNRNYNKVTVQDKYGQDYNINYGYNNGTAAFKWRAAFGKRLHDKISVFGGFSLLSLLSTDLNSITTKPNPYPYDELDHRTGKTTFFLDLGLIYSFGKKHNNTPKKD